MLELIGWSAIGVSNVGLSYPAFESVFLKGKYTERKMKENLQKAFVNAELYKKHGNKKEYPNILKTDLKREHMTFVFNIPKGLSPDKVKSAVFVFKQHFGAFVDLNVNEKRGILKVYPKGLPNKFQYNYEDIKENLKGKLPIVCGHSLDGSIFSFDLVEYPHILIAGETGSGKSSQIRALLTTLIKHKTPKELRLILGDLKRSEFHLFKQIEHVEGVR